MSSKEKKKRKRIDITPQNTGLTPQQKIRRIMNRRTKNHKKRYKNIGNKTRKIVIAKSMKKLREDLAMMNLEDNPSPSKYYIPRDRENNSMVKTLKFSAGKKRKRRKRRKRKKTKRRRRKTKKKGGHIFEATYAAHSLASDMTN